MSPQNVLYRQWLGQCSFFCTQIEMLKKKQDAEVLHNARVSFKKIRSYLSLAGIITGHKELGKSLPETISLFRVLGKRRDIDMSLQLISSFKKNNGMASPEFEHHLRTAVQDAAAWVQQALAGYNNGGFRSVKAKMTKLVAALQEEQLAEQLRRVIILQLRRVNDLAKDFRTGFHEIRKRLKEIYYWEKLYPAGLVFTTRQIKQLNAVLDKLGKLQDHVVLLEKMRSYRKLYLPGKTGMYDEAKKSERVIKKMIDQIFLSLPGDLEKLLRSVKHKDQQENPLIFSAPGGS